MVTGLCNRLLAGLGGTNLGSSTKTKCKKVVDGVKSIESHAHSSKNEERHESVGCKIYKPVSVISQAGRGVTYKQSHQSA